MTIAERFTSALAEVTDPALAGPELLPLRLARASARTLAVDGAGLSLVDASQQRIPLGASSAVAEVAERLQFTVGAGPC
ncbi:MAG: GAF domain-containing protein, partial [Blastococcus sp.]